MTMHIPQVNHFTDCTTPDFTWHLQAVTKWLADATDNHTCVYGNYVLLFKLNVNKVCLYDTKWQYAGIWSGNGFGTKRRQALIWINAADTVHWRLYVSPGFMKLYQYFMLVPIFSVSLSWACTIFPSVLHIQWNARSELNNVLNIFQHVFVDNLQLVEM